MNDARTIAIGCMRLSTDPDRDDDRSVEVLHAAFDAGVTLLDTADAYCLDERDIGHNERLIARALSTWSGDRSRITIATKGGMTRPEGRWEPDGRAKHLRAACERSCRALGVDRIALYQLHAPDPRTPLSTSVRALAALKRDGLIAAIGLSQRHRRPDRRSATHHGDRLHSGRAQRLERCLDPERRRRRIASRTACGCSPTVRSAGGVRRRARRIIRCCSASPPLTACRRSTSPSPGSMTSRT